jgi:hypothetical protein
MYVCNGASNLDADSGLAPMSSLGVVSVMILLVAYSIILQHAEISSCIEGI